MAKLSRLQIFQDSNSNVTEQTSGYALPGEDAQAFQFLLTLNVETTLSVPDWAKFARFKYAANTDVWVRQGSVAVTVPAGAPVAQASELRPDLIPVIPGDTLRFICATAAEVNVIFYPDPTEKFNL